MEFKRCECVEHGESTVRYVVEFDQEEMAPVSEIAYGFLYEEAKIDVINNADPLKSLRDALGEPAINGYLGNFLQNYVASYLAESLDFYPYGKPFIVDVSNEDGVDSGCIALSIEYKRTPSMELKDYGPYEIRVPAGEFDSETKARYAYEALLDQIVGDIDPEDFKVTLDEMTERFFTTIRLRNISVEGYCKKNKLDDKSLHMSIFNAALDSFKENMALDALYRHHGLSCTKDDERVILIQMHADNPDGIRRRLEETHATSSLRQAAERQCARRWLMETTVFVADDAMVDYSKLTSDEALDLIRSAVDEMSSEGGSSSSGKEV